jgi:hypothetical protein
VQAVLDEQNQPEAAKVARNFRMAYVATVTLHDVGGEAIHTIRCGRIPKGDARGLCRGLASDVVMRAQRPDLKVAYLTDGTVIPVQIAAGVHAVKPVRLAAVTSVHGARAAACREVIDHRANECFHALVLDDAHLHPVRVLQTRREEVDALPTAIDEVEVDVPEVVL